jgi:hypothetical protein
MSHRGSGRRPKRRADHALPSYQRYLCVAVLRTVRHDGRDPRFEEVGVRNRPIVGLQPVPKRKLDGFVMGLQQRKVVGCELDEDAVANRG